MRTVYISKYPNPETEVVENENNIWIECKFKNFMGVLLRAAQRMRPDRIIIDYESFMNNDEDDEEF